MPLLVCFAFSMSAFSQVKTVPLPTDIRGLVDGDAYRNSFFGFELDLPKGWLALGQEDQATAKDIGTDALKSEDPSYAKTIQNAVDAELVVLTYAKKPLGAMGNSTLAIGILKQPSNRVTPRMVVEGTKSLLLHSSANKLVRDVQVETIGKTPLASMIIDLSMLGQVVHIKYYAMMLKGYSVTVAMSYSDEEAIKEMDAALRTIRFNN